MRSRLAIILFVLAAVVLAPGRWAMPASGAPAGRAGDSKLDCVYSANSERVLARFEALVHRRLDCVEVYANEAQSWTQWVHPWFLNDQPGYAWAQWATTPGTQRELVVDLSLIPTTLARTAWRGACARGEFVSHARSLARNLVAAGLSHTVIRLAGEMNGTWNVDNVGETTHQMREWAACWRRTVLAMRQVTGARFRIDFSINAAVRPLALRSFYPGNRTVDIIGIDAYDQGIAPGERRWESIYDRPDGIRAVLAFADAHHKPLSIPEWGLAAAADGDGGGDDPAYVRGIANIVRGHDVAYQSYFFNHGFASELAHDRRSLRLYRALFAGG